MDASYISLGCLIVSILYFLSQKLKKSSHGSSVDGPLPPGKTGWPLVGETLEFLSNGWKGQREKFVMDRMAKYSSYVFKTHLLGEPFAVFCGAAGNKFLFSNENKLVRLWLPRSIDKIVGYSETSSAEESFYLRKMVANFLTPKGLQGYVGIMDEVAQRHFTENWNNKTQVEVLDLTRLYAFSLACRLLLGIDEKDPRRISLFSEPFNVLLSGFLSVPINLPGTPMNKAIKASKLIREHIAAIIKQRKADLAQGKASPTQDILSGILSAPEDENDKFMSEESIAGRILGLLVAGHDTSSVACAFLVKHLAEHPDIYNSVRNEQLEIAKSKGPGEFLNWEDLQRMKYSWNVVCEVLRMSSPAQGTFREAIVDFTFKGYTIPKGWKLYWTVNSTHKNPEFFPEPEKFDPSRFEGSGPAPYTFVPFGGGPRMCPGKEYARLEILVFLHHLVKKFKWEKIIPDEKTVVDVVATPAKGLPVRLFPHEA